MLTIAMIQILTHEVCAGTHTPTYVNEFKPKHLMGNLFSHKQKTNSMYLLLITSQPAVNLEN